MIGRLSFYILAAVVVLAPLPFGSVEPIWIVIWTLLLALSLLTVSLREIRGAHIALVAPVLALVPLFGAALWLQTLPDPPLDAANPIWREAAKILHTSMPARIAVDVSQPWKSLGAPLCVLMAFLSGFLNCTDRRRAERMFRIAAVAGAVYAVYALASFLLIPTTLLWREKYAYVDSVTGTFVNRNTAATFFGSCAILWFSLASAELYRLRPDGVQAWAAVLKQPPRRLMIAAAAFLICLVALLMTKSRAGNLLTFAALFVCGALVAARRFKSAESLLSVGAAALVGALLFELWGGGIAARVGSEGLALQGRAVTDRSTLAIIADYPGLGTGLGTFAEVFPSYRTGDASTLGVWDRAHNTPLELAAEMGIPIAAAVVSVWVAGLLLLVRGSLRRRRDEIYPIAATGIVLLAATHSLVDFSLQIPGFAIVCAVLGGMGVAQSVSSAPSRQAVGAETAATRLPPASAAASRPRRAVGASRSSSAPYPIIRHRAPP